MKRTLALSFLALALFGFLSKVAHAGITVVGMSANAAGGTIYMFKGVDECNTGVGVLLKLPFTEGIPGCVTSVTSTTVHVYYKTGLEMDYDISLFTPIKANTKGAT